MIRQKTFATVETCDDDEVDRLKLSSLYSEHATVETCSVYWHLKQHTARNNFLYSIRRYGAISLV